MAVLLGRQRSSGEVHAGQRLHAPIRRRDEGVLYVRMETGLTYQIRPMQKQLQEKRRTLLNDLFYQSQIDRLNQKLRESEMRRSQLEDKLSNLEFKLFITMIVLYFVTILSVGTAVALRVW